MQLLYACFLTCRNLIRSSASVKTSILLRYPITRKHAGSWMLERNCWISWFNINCMEFFTSFTMFWKHINEFWDLFCCRLHWRTKQTEQKNHISGAYIFCNPIWELARYPICRLMQLSCEIGLFYWPKLTINYFFVVHDKCICILHCFHFEWNYTKSSCKN